MQYFREFVTKKEIKSQLKKTIALLPKVYKLYSNLIKSISVSGINEALEPVEPDFYSKSGEELNSTYFIRNVVTHKKFEDFMNYEYNAKYETEYDEPKWNAGAEGVVFFYTNKICVKFKKYLHELAPEWDVACELAGKLELVPILGCFDVAVKKRVIPGIVMKTLNIPDMTRELKLAYTALSRYMDSVIRSLDQSDTVSHNTVGMMIDPDNVIDNLKRHVAPKLFPKPEEVFNEKTESAIRDMVTILKEIYGQTAYLFGSDFGSGRNIGGYSGGKLVPFDIGMGIRTRNLPAPNKTQIILD